METETKNDLLQLWSDTQMRAAYHSTQCDKVSEILYDVEEGMREEHRSGVPMGLTVQDLVTRLREGYAEVRNRWMEDLDIARHGIR